MFIPYQIIDFLKKYIHENRKNTKCIYYFVRIHKIVLKVHRTAIHFLISMFIHPLQNNKKKLHRFSRFEER